MWVLVCVSIRYLITNDRTTSTIYLFQVSIGLMMVPLALDLIIRFLTLFRFIKRKLWFQLFQLRRNNKLRIGNYLITFTPFIKIHFINNFSPSLVFTAWNCGDKSVPTTNAVNEIQIPVKCVYLPMRNRNPINSIPKHNNWKRKPRNCNFVIIINC